MKLFDSECMRNADNYTINTLKVPSTLLMTNAAGYVARAAMNIIKEGESAVVFCGSGNNGGDGVAAAVYLLGYGVPVRVFLIGRREKMTQDTMEMERRLIEAGGKIEDFDEDTANECCGSCGVIIDAMFGIGLNSDLRGNGLKAAEIINSSKAQVVAADIASGIEADTGKVLGEAVRADITVTFSAAKPGHYLEPGCLYSGKVVVCDIGIPEYVIEEKQPGFFAVTQDDISLPRRKRISHKGDYGKVLVIGGSTGYTGAPVMASRAALRCGSGLIWLGVPENIYGITAAKCLEEMPFPVKTYDDILNKIKGCDACLLGPGMGNTIETRDTVRRVLQSSSVPLVLDADGINAVAAEPEILDKASCPVVLTPHDGEFTRLYGAVGSAGRAAAASEFAVRHRCVVVLKGHRTLTAFQDGTVYINTTGNPGMSTGGSGDVLAGMVLSFLGQGLPVKKAVITAVFLHGMAGDLCAAKYGEYSMTPGDMLNMLPETLKAVTEI